VRKILQVTDGIAEGIPVAKRSVDRENSHAKAASERVNKREGTIIASYILPATIGQSRYAGLTFGLRSIRWNAVVAEIAALDCLSMTIQGRLPDAARKLPVGPGG
jgi:hypothetical protein